MYLLTAHVLVICQSLSVPPPPFLCMQSCFHACKIEFFLNTLNNKLICWWNQDQIDVAVKQLLALKVEFKKRTGQDYKPGMPPPTSAPPATAAAASSSTPSGLYERVAQQGENVRKLKSEKAPKVSWHREHLTLWFSLINIESKDSWLCITVCRSWSKCLTFLELLKKFPWCESHGFDLVHISKSLFYIILQITKLAAKGLCIAAVIPQISNCLQMSQVFHVCALS